MTTPHDYFGSMEFDEHQRSYRATLNFSPTHKVSVAIDLVGISPAEALKRSQAICERIRVREPEYRSAVAREFLPLYNDEWRNGEMIDADGFMRRISLDGIDVSPGEFDSFGCTIYYADGDLFAGHSIEVFLDADLNYVNSGLAG